MQDIWHMYHILCEGQNYVCLSRHKLYYIALGIHSMMLIVQETENKPLANGYSTQLGEGQQNRTTSLKCARLPVEALHECNKSELLCRTSGA